MSKAQRCDICGKFGTDDTPGGSYPVPLGWYKYEYRTTDGYQDYVIKKMVCGLDCLIKAIPELKSQLDEATKKAGWL